MKIVSDAFFGQTSAANIDGLAAWPKWARDAKYKHLRDVDSRTVDWLEKYLH
jgi:hypothetical protein